MPESIKQNFHAPTCPQFEPRWKNVLETGRRTGPGTVIDQEGAVAVTTHNGLPVVDPHGLVGGGERLFTVHVKNPYQRQGVFVRFGENNGLACIDGKLFALAPSPDGWEIRRRVVEEYQQLLTALLSNLMVYENPTPEIGISVIQYPLFQTA